MMRSYRSQYVREVVGSSDWSSMNPVGDVDLIGVNWVLESSGGVVGQGT